MRMKLGKKGSQQSKQPEYKKKVTTDYAPA